MYRREKDYAWSGYSCAVQHRYSLNAFSKIFHLAWMELFDAIHQLLVRLLPLASTQAQTQASQSTALVAGFLQCISHQSTQPNRQENAPLTCVSVHLGVKQIILVASDTFPLCQAEKGWCLAPPSSTALSWWRHQRQRRRTWWRHPQCRTPAQRRTSFS